MPNGPQGVSTEKTVHSPSSTSALGPPFSTKFTPPRVLEEGTLRRPRLLGVLHAHLQKRATCVVAPAGYGKTTLLAQFADEVDALVCWCTLDEGDRDARAFVASLVAAIARGVPGFGAAALQSLRDAGREDESLQVRGAMGLLVTELHERSPDFLVLVVDECQTIEGCVESNAALDLLLEHLPPHCHLVLAGRSLPALPSLTRLAPRRQVTRLGQSALRLTLEQTEQLLATLGLSGITAEQVAALDAQTQGWPMAVQLFAAYASEQAAAPDSERQAGALLADLRRLPRPARQELFTFLAADVLNHQPTFLQDFLLSTSVLPYVEVGRCAALLGRPRDEVRRLLAAVEAHALFLVRLEETAGDDAQEALTSPVATGDAPERQSYRYHALFREFLLEALREQQPVRYRWLQRRASRLAEEAGDLAAAVEHALAAACFARAARLIERAAPACIADGRWRALNGWLQALPDVVLERRPELLITAARALDLATGDFIAAGALLDRVDRDLLPNEVERARLDLLRAQFAVQCGEYHQAADLCRGVLGQMASDAPPQLRADAHYELYSNLRHLGLLQEAEEALYASVTLYAKAGDVSAEARARDAAGALALRTGDLGKGIVEMERARDAWQRLGNTPALARTLNNLGMAHQQLGEFSAACALLEEATQLAHAAGMTAFEACAWLSLGDVLRDQNSLGRASAAYTRGRELAIAHHDSYLIRFATDALGQLHRLSGPLDRAELMCRQALAEARAAGSRYEEGLYLRSVALVHLERREFEAARASLHDATSILQACGAQRELARTWLYRIQLAVSARRRKDVPAAVKEMERLLGELGYSGFLLADAQRAAEALRYACAMGFAGPRLEALIDAAEPASVEAETIPEGPRTIGALAEPRAPARPFVTPVAAQAALEVAGFGRSEVRYGGRVVTDLEWRSPKSKELFFYLLCHPGWQRREQIVAAIWMDAAPAQARSGFHSNAHRLRRALHPDILQENHGRYRLNPGVRCWFDVAEFEQRCEELLKQRFDEFAEEQARRADEALQLYQGPLLDDLSPEWGEVMRTRLGGLFVALALQLGRYHAAQAEHQDAIRLAEQALTVDPYLEPAHASLMEWYAAAGQHAAAAHHYRQYSAQLMRELGEDPPPAVVALHRRIVGGAAERSGGLRAIPSSA